MHISNIFYINDWKKNRNNKIIEKKSFLKCVRRTSYHTTDRIYSKHELIFTYLFLLLAQRIHEWNEDPKGLKKFCKMQTSTQQSLAELNWETLKQIVVISNI